MIKRMLQNKEQRDLGMLLIFSLASLTIGLLGFMIEMIWNNQYTEVLSSSIAVFTNIFIMYYTIKYWRTFHLRSLKREEEHKKQQEPTEQEMKLLTEMAGITKEHFLDMYNFKKQRREMAWLMILVIVVNSFSIYSNIFL